MKYFLIKYDALYLFKFTKKNKLAFYFERMQLKNNII